jgi:hypothetical protein
MPRITNFEGAEVKGSTDPLITVSLSPIAPCTHTVGARARVKWKRKRKATCKTKQGRDWRTADRMQEICGRLSERRRWYWLRAAIGENNLLAMQ